IIADGNTLTLITDPEIAAGQTVEVVYSDSTPDDEQGIRDSDGNVLDIFDAISVEGVENNSERLISLVDDNVSAIFDGPQNVNVVATYSDTNAVELLNGTSEVAVLDFTIEENTSSVLITVQQENLVSLANAFTFVVRNMSTGEEFEVSSANTSQGGLVAGALGLELLGGVADAQGLRLDINDLPPGNYEVSVYGDSSQLADILTTIDLASLGDGTVNDLVSDTVLGLVETALTGPDVDPRGILEQLALGDLLALAGRSPTLSGLVDTLESVLNNPLLSSITGQLLESSVAEIISGETGGVLGLILAIPIVGDGLAAALDAAVNGLIGGILEGVDGAGQALFDNLVEPLISDILLETVIEDTGLSAGLDTILGSVNTLLETLGLGSILPTMDGLIDLIAQEALSNPLTLFGGTTAEVYVVNGEVYRAIGNIQETSVDGTQADQWEDGVLTAINGQPVTFESSDEGGNYTTIEGTYGQLKLYENGNFSYVYNSVAGQDAALRDVFTYTVTRNAGQENEETASADLTINIDTVNQIINYADDPADNLLQGGAGDDILTGGAGADTAIYYLLVNADATGGNGTDIWTDFSLNEGDAIDVSALLTGANAENISEYISVEVNDNNATVISIDRDGAGTQFRDKVELITLEGVNTNLEELLSNGHIIY
ncbi:type I secretion C-terminal target domain-containing protein, partial [Acinetobacter schindleri]|uniref:type I secretion C-terminal target domain-containing protein n=1 Tax=Acinetobacter schindleri TaxID=108981 RepID=UPI003F552DD2